MGVPLTTMEEARPVSPVRLIDETLQEEKHTDEALTSLALAGVNAEAMAA